MAATVSNRGAGWLQSGQGCGRSYSAIGRTSVNGPQSAHSYSYVGINALLPLSPQCAISGVSRPAAVADAAARNHVAEQHDAKDACMNGQVDLTQFAQEKYAVGQPVPRKEDPTLLRGQGRYTDDLNLPGQAYAVMVRSNIAHGIIRAIDTEAAKALPGVLAVLTGQDLTEGGLGAMPAGMSFRNRDGSEMPKPVQPVLTTDKVRFVGDPIAVVVAETARQAKDGAEAVFAGVDALPAVTEAAAPVAAGAPLPYDATPGNVILDFHHGDTASVEAAFARAAHVTRLGIRNSRVVVCPMEPRSAIGEYDPESERWTLRLGCQGGFGCASC
jgi:aerobic carbon-monoxide dehydrogenase large subunit